jgi:hypothetical protein
MKTPSTICVVYKREGPAKPVVMIKSIAACFTA